MDSTSRENGGRVWRQPEFQAAAFNGALILLAPGIWATYIDYTGNVVRPSEPTVLASAIRALPILATLTPIAVLVAWRSYFHARAYRLNRRTIWRGPLESAAVAGLPALLIMLAATKQTWSREPARLVAAYIAFYAGATALAGLVLGVILAVTAVLVIHIAGARSAASAQ